MLDSQKMPESALFRFLELLRRELSADDAYIQIGGRPSEDPRVLFQDVGDQTRIVVAFEKPPAQREPLAARLSALAETFQSTVEAAADAPAPPRSSRDVARQRLDEELSALAERAGADRAFVFDFDSPVIWGASSVRGDAGTTSGLNQALERAVAELRDDHVEELRKNHGHTLRLTLASGQEVLARPFASIYVLALSFSAPLSEPIALGAVLHAAGVIERLVLALPPVDPSPGAKVIRLVRRG